MLEADSVRKFYAGKLVLSDVWLRCETGDVIALLGRNGSGKSTLLKILFGIECADFCFLKIDGLKTDSPNGRIKWISYLPQASFVPKNFSVRKAIRLSIEPDKVAAFLNDAMIADCLDKKVRELSAGELRYLDIKLVLSNTSKFVLLDEPFNGLSPILVEAATKLIGETTHKGIIITDHRYRGVLAVSNKLILMRDGKAFHLESEAELIEKGYLREGML